ncbi:enkurin domain-containing protein 1 [Histomonas meleagridis]|uniref:enkurin domain-containing protein 1 n=1 Tax=Histomonas meleagridis TaxID=135588 RepID=UPI00355AA106|nr:enkurin domain-containing protein 1 [Histomonas meleagridis]KAH0796214.1 enkurin domain-containing protein 1 [Histomonas meleagridis]
MGKKPTKNEPRINFVQRNIQSASQQKSRAKPDKPKGMKERIVNSKHAPGEIPKYLEQRKDEIKAKNAPPPDVKCPKGMRLLSDEEKQEAVLSLQQRKQEIEATLAKAPLRIESPQLLRNERQLRQELSEIESTLRHFKKKYVFVNEDEHF